MKKRASNAYHAGEEMKRNAIGEKLAAARYEAGLSLVELSRSLASYGVTISRHGINKWEHGETVPNAYQYIAACRALGLSADELPPLNRQGLKKLEEYKADLIATGMYAPEPAFTGEVDYIDMPVSCLAASAGTGAFLDEGNYEIISVPRKSVPAGAVLGIRVSGDSMEPVYNDGQIAWIERSDSLRPGEVGIFAYDGNGYIKVYGEKTPDRDVLEAFTDSYGVVHKQPVLISYNKKYQPWAVSPEASFQIVGRVLN